jgi:hypothetical protein
VTNDIGKVRVDVALGAIIADGFFCAAFTLHLMSSQTIITLADFIGMGVIICVFLTSCWVIYDDYWLAQRHSAANIVKKLRIKEMEQGATIDFDGKSYRVDAIDRESGEIRIARVGKSGNIIVQIEGQG